MMMIIIVVVVVIGLSQKNTLAPQMNLQSCGIKGYQKINKDSHEITWDGPEKVSL